MSDIALQSAVQEYARRRSMNVDLETPLGYGTDGAVWKSSRKSAVKAFERPGNYRLELSCYQRLQGAQIRDIRGFAVPQLIDHDDELLVIEMTIVAPPFILDFAKVSLDRRVEFPPETLDDWRESMQELFEDRWPEVRLLLAALERYGIYYLDAKPGNIMFPPEP
jgi:hypothetical protein